MSKSPLGLYKTKEHKARKKERYQQNVEYRRKLNRDKANARSMEERSVIQGQIDEISRRK